MLYECCRRYFMGRRTIHVMPAQAGIQEMVIAIVKTKQFFVYILASKKNGTVYVGVTSDLIKRVWEHKNGLVDGFTNQYDVKMLVYYEMHDNAENAIRREKQIKKWRRQWKVNLIEKKNLHWKDLYKDIC